MTGTGLPEHNFHPAYRADIDGLRALAILAVIAFHAFPNTLRSGYTGVDVFFVISGFLISSIVFKSLVRGDFSFREFYLHRIKYFFWEYDSTENFLFSQTIRAWLLILHVMNCTWQKNKKAYLSDGLWS